MSEGDKAKNIVARQRVLSRCRDVLICFSEKMFQDIGMPREEVETSGSSCRLIDEAVDMHRRLACLPHNITLILRVGQKYARYCVPLTLDGYASSIATLIILLSVAVIVVAFTARRRKPSQDAATCDDGKGPVSPSDVLYLIRTSPTRWEDLLHKLWKQTALKSGMCCHGA